MNESPYVDAQESPRESLLTLFLIFLRLGLTSFGGPVAHLGYFREEFVTRRRWLSERSYADLVALCQFLPGPASSQVGLGVGLSRGGMLGAFAAWTGFTLPSALALILFALGIQAWSDQLPSGLLQGLKVVAVAVVAQAVWGMARSLCPDRARVTLGAAAACVVLSWPTAFGQIGVIAVGALIGMVIFKSTAGEKATPLGVRISLPLAMTALALFAVLLVALPFVASFSSSQSLALFDSFYRSGSLVFGGGHVVLPLLQSEVVPPGWVDEETFLAGYGAAQAVPGPLFTFSAFLGASLTSAPSGWLGGGLCLIAIFIPSFLLVIGALPFWDRLRQHVRIQSALTGVNAAVVGLLLAALYDPVWTSGIKNASHFSLALGALVALMAWKWPPWFVVLGCAVFGVVLW